MQLQHLLLLLLSIVAAHHSRTASAASLQALQAAASAAGGGGGGHSLDAWCVAYRCPGQSYACVTSSECRGCLRCLHDCAGAPASAACSAGCLYRCRAEALLADFLSCAVTEHGCVQLTPTEAEAAADEDSEEQECRPESLEASGPPAPLAEVGGRWFAVSGGHRFHDCHPCRTELLDLDGAGLVVGGFRFDGVRVEHRRQVLASWPENGSLLLGHTKVGQAVTEAWRLSWWAAAPGDAQPQTQPLLLLSYCGSAGVWRYRGRLLLSRRPWRPELPAPPTSSEHEQFACRVAHDPRLCSDSEEL